MNEALTGPWIDHSLQEFVAQEIARSNSGHENGFQSEAHLIILQTIACLLADIASSQREIARWAGPERQY